MAKPNKVTCIVATAKVLEDVSLQSTDPADVHLRVGEELSVVFNYKLYEKSALEDLWTLRLTVQVDGEETTEHENVHKDRKIAGDDLYSHVVADVRFPSAGTFAVKYQASANLSRKAWEDRAPPETVSEKTVSGAFNVVVS